MKPADDGSPTAICCGEEIMPEPYIHPRDYALCIAWECPVCHEVAIQYTGAKADPNHAILEEGVGKPGSKKRQKKKEQ